MKIAYSLWGTGVHAEEWEERKLETNYLAIPSNILHYLKYCVPISAEQSSRCLRKMPLHQATIFLSLLMKQQTKQRPCSLFVFMGLYQDASPCCNMHLWPWCISAQAEGRMLVFSDCNTEELHWKLKKRFFVHNVTFWKLYFSPPDLWSRVRSCIIYLLA